MNSIPSNPEGATVTPGGGGNLSRNPLQPSIIEQVVFATVRSPIICAVIGLVYAVPATIAGYNATLGLSQMGVPSGAWRVAFAVVGGKAWTRMVLFVPPGGDGRGAESPALHRLAGARRKE